MASDYEKQRLQNLADNRRILEEIGLTKKFTATPKVTFKKCIRALKRKAENEVTEIKPPAKKAAVLDPESSGSVRGTRRRSARIMGQEVQTKEEMDQEVKEWEEENEENRHIPVPAHRPNMYGAIENVEMGTWWPTRMECCRAGIHRPTVAGIHGGQEGAYSIALSGGYDDNVDLGEAFTYTGEGGRDLKGTANNPKNLRTAPQSKDQELSRGNLALSRNIETGNPVRVIRGYKLTSPFAPEEGYRYDGLYMVEKAWFTQGLSGFMVWKFALRRVQDQPPPPWTIVEDDAENVNKENVSPNKNKLMRSDSHQSGDSGVDMSADEKQTVLEDVSEETEIENKTHPNEDGQNDDGNDGNNDKIKKETSKSPVKAGKNVDSDDDDCGGNDRSDDEIKNEASTNAVTDNEKNGNNDEEDKSDDGNSSDKDDNDGEKDSG